MKILHVLQALHAGGAEGFVTNLAVSQASLGVDVRVFLLAGVRDERGRTLLSRLEHAGIDVFETRERRAASLSNLLRLTRLIRSWKPDIVQATTYPAEAACAAARLLTIRNASRYVRRLANTEQVGYRSATALRSIDRLFHQVIAYSPAVASAYVDFMRNKRREKLVTIPNGGLLQAAVTNAQAKMEARKRLGFASDDFVIAHIGRMFPGGRSLSGGLETSQKAHDVLVKAFAKAFQGDPSCVLALVGDGPLRPEVERLTRQCALEEKVRFLGQQAEPWPVLRAADVFCFPSRHEGLPNVLPEAASCGLPVIASDIPEIRDLSTGDAWQLVPVDDVERFAEALRVARAQQTLRTERACEAAPQLRARFSMDTCARRYLLAYESIARRKSIAFPDGCQERRMWATCQGGIDSRPS